MEIENEPVSKLLASLERVEAPGDFDFCVKARIAGRRSAKKPSWIPAFVKVAVPAGVLIAGGYFGFNALYLSNQTPQATSPTTASIAPQAAPATQIAAENIETKPSPVSVAREGTKQPGTVAKTGAPLVDKAVPRTATPSRTADGSHLDEAVRHPHVFSEKNANQNMSVPKTTGFLSLPQIGVSTINDGKTVTVGSVRAGSIAERSGMKVGDVIEANDGKTIRVRRDGKSLQLDLKP